MYYHASQTKNIKVLQPRISNHNTPLIYFSSKRENVLVYLCNAVEKYCKENNFKYDGIYSKWGPYSFDKTDKIQIEEYYPNFLYETYKGVSGYIYKTEKIPNSKKLKDIPDVYVTSSSVNVDSVEFIEDAYETIMEEVNKGNIILIKYEDFINDEEKRKWLYKTIKNEYDNSINHSEYRFFLEKKFPNII